MLGGRRGFVDSTPARETEEARRRDPGGDTEWSRKETRLQAQRPTSDGPKVGETARLLQSGPSDRLDNGRVAILPAQPKSRRDPRDSSLTRGAPVGIDGRGGGGMPAGVEFSGR